MLESVQAIPGETSVVVLDANGQPLPLVTQEAADAVALGDPIWCPSGQPPTPGANGCTFSNNSLAILLSNLSGSNGFTGIAANGTIWIESSYNSSINDPAAIGFTLDGSTVTTWANYSLTLQGGWNGIYGSTGIVSNSVFSVPLTIQNWHNGITVQNINAPSITISDATIQNSGISVSNVNAEVNLRRINVNRTNGVFGHGLQVITSGNINLENINATANSITQGDGAYLDNTSGTGNVTLTGANNIFSNHHDFSSGMYIVSNGTVSLSNITANDSGRGVNISRAGSVSVTNGTFNGNFFNGLYVVNTSGNVTLNNINIDGTNGTGTGLYVNTTGAINGNNITSNNNIQRGGGPCPIDCGDGAYLIGNNGVTLTGTNTFDNNGWTGLDAHSSNGVITLNYITAKNNAQWGAYSTGANDIVLNGTNVFDGNAAG
ncbi:MAG TPA: hypothetical protein VN843_35120, partial [Anaerolineales bacterium]|nr:hypothetical protein [Anaerolineales bacterium]